MIASVSEAGCSGLPLRVLAIDDEFVRLFGQFGALDVGDLSLVWLDDSGESITRQPLGHVDPLALTTLDQVASRPAGARHTELRVMASADGIERLLENIAV